MSDIYAMRRRATVDIALDGPRAGVTAVLSGPDAFGTDRIIETIPLGEIEMNGHGFWVTEFKRPTRRHIGPQYHKRYLSSPTAAAYDLLVRHTGRSGKLSMREQWHRAKIG